jgi:hypothetical protein
MELKPKQPTIQGPADWFTGDVWIDSIVQPHDHSRLNVVAVHFTPEHAPPGTPTTAARPSTSPRDAVLSRHEVNPLWSSEQETPSGHPTAKTMARCRSQPLHDPHLADRGRADLGDHVTEDEYRGGE